MPTEITLPAHVEALQFYPDGRPVLQCTAPRHTEPRVYVGRTGPNGAACPLCMALELAEEDRGPRGEQ